MRKKDVIEMWVTSFSKDLGIKEPKSSWIRVDENILRMECENEEDAKELGIRFDQYETLGGVYIDYIDVYNTVVEVDFVFDVR